MLSLNQIGSSWSRAGRFLQGKSWAQNALSKTEYRQFVSITFASSRRTSILASMNDKSKGKRPERFRSGGRRRNHAQAVPSEFSAPDLATPQSQPLAEVSGALDAPRFSDLAGQNLVHPSIIQTITDDLKFDRMMPVQAATLATLLPPSRSDCLVQAKTGTGKTVAFLLPALQTLINQNRGPDAGISLLVISPTRELALQIADEANKLLQRLPKYRIRVAIGGTNRTKENQQILSGCDVLIATPGRLIDHMSDEPILSAFRHLDTLVLDEADRLLDMGFMPALKEIVGHLPDRGQTKRQGMLFSATIAPHVQQVAGFILSPGYKFISTIPEGEVNTHQRVPQLLIKVPTFSSLAPALIGSIREELAQHQDFKAIVFAPTAALAILYERVLSQISGLPPVSSLSSRNSQSRRMKVTNEYREAKSAILVATDVVARGMDFPGVTTVFQVGIPSDKQSYIHRLGRTARANAEGRGIFIVCEAEAWFPTRTLKEIPFITHEANLASAAEVDVVAEAMEENFRAKVYQAFLGYYKNHLKALKFTPEELVVQGNLFACEGLKAPGPPRIFKSTVGKMGLRGTKGLNVVPDPPKIKRTEAAEAAA
ncbi:hypothetical protein XA68_17762 [Ophiocordyceps unilateralis]|uniref:ATP-dependent RNA helicase n=1 Tax=Ophiocordyceps unilateralis TaxID=268505 RepID=A0A2A9PP30_OPHUN|nr:hypothetical protein XA68_17762 [Ophiocordyceps unilateralis]